MTALSGNVIASIKQMHSLCSEDPPAKVAKEVCLTAQIVTLRLRSETQSQASCKPEPVFTGYDEHKNADRVGER